MISYSRRWPGAMKAHRFRKSAIDKACECRMSKNYRVHQPFWWRWFNPGKQYRT